MQRILTIIFGLAVIGVLLYIVSRCTTVESRKIERTDVVTIDTLSQFGKLERPPVIFLHDLHTHALEKQKKDCQACHRVDDDGYYSQKFLRFKDDGKQVVMDLYHEKCIACHRETSASGMKSGPTTANDCGVCHQHHPLVKSLRQEMGFDKSLHYRHLKANDEKCELCHHLYDESKKELYYEKGQESSCRDCHRQETEENCSSMSIVAHKQCIGCHQKNIAENKKAGPQSCEGCHDINKQLAYKKITEVPRLESNQPDVAFISAADLKISKMKTVFFNHKLHEAAADSCRVCHHESKKACKECHTIPGDDKAEGVKLVQSMHDIVSEHSCLGCHNSEKSKSACAGCHSIMEEEAMSENACFICHAGPSPDDPVLAEVKPEDYDKLLPQQEYAGLTWTDEDITKEIVINILEDKYEPVTFPHRKMIDALLKIIGNSALAKYFHGHENVVCMSCHHKSSVDKKPIACSNCHGQPFNDDNPGMPGLQSAYHLQCIMCHEKMGFIKLIDCASCHKEKKE